MLISVVGWPGAGEAQSGHWGKLQLEKSCVVKRPVFLAVHPVLPLAPGARGQAQGEDARRGPFRPPAAGGPPRQSRWAAGCTVLDGTGNNTTVLSRTVRVASLVPRGHIQGVRKLTAGTVCKETGLSFSVPSAWSLSRDARPLTFTLDCALTRCNELGKGGSPLGSGRTDGFCEEFCACAWGTKATPPVLLRASSPHSTAAPPSIPQPPTLPGS